MWGKVVVRDGVSRLGAALIGWEGDMQLSLGRQTPRVRMVGWWYMGNLGGQKCRSFGGWWVECSSWWRGMADLPGVVAGVAVVWRRWLEQKVRVVARGGRPARWAASPRVGA